jgi:RNA polymerase sigma-70 factor, ECF subfamily
MLSEAQLDEVVTAFEASLSNVAREPSLGGEARAHLERIVKGARAAHPTVSVSLPEFAMHLAAVIDDRDPLAALGIVLGADLFLAYAAVRGDVEAVRIFDETCVRPLQHVLRRGDTSDEQVRETLQELRVALLVGPDGGVPRLGRYAARGDLRSWVRVAATRLLINAKRDGHREEIDDDLALADRADIEDVELTRLKSVYEKEFRESFNEALGALSTRARNLLRQHYVDALTMEQIGVIYRVHRITVLRWIERARQELAAATRERMAGRLELQGAEVESILRLIHSQMGISLRMLFSDTDRSA